MMIIIINNNDDEISYIIIKDKINQHEYHAVCL